MKKSLLLTLCFFCFNIVMFAQLPTNMKIKLKSGDLIEHNIDNIENITFVEEVKAIPGIEVTNINKTVGADGLVTIKFNIKTTNAVAVLCAPKPAINTEDYLKEDWESWSDLFISWKSQPQHMIDQMNTANGAEVTYNGLDPMDYYILARAKNAEGNTKTVAVKVP